jgi:hypothetical protein
LRGSTCCGYMERLSYGLNRPASKPSKTARCLHAEWPWVRGAVSDCTSNQTASFSYPSESHAGHHSRCATPHQHRYQGEHICQYSLWSLINQLRNIVLHISFLTNICAHRSCCALLARRSSRELPPEADRRRCCRCSSNGSNSTSASHAAILLHHPSASSRPTASSTPGPTVCLAAGNM